MARSKSTTVAGYLKELPAERRRDIAKVRAVIKKNLPAGFAETMNWGMISYEVPLSTFSSTYNKQPLMYVALAAQKNFNTLYLMSAHISKPLLTKLQSDFKKTGKKLDMGKSCIHFDAADELPLDTIGEVVASMPMRDWIAIFEASRKK